MELGLGEGREAELLIEAVSVAGHEMEAAKILQARMRVDEAQGGFGESAFAVSFEDVNVAEIGEGGVVGDNAHEADLFIVG